jgi:hypothetical protein
VQFIEFMTFNVEGEFLSLFVHGYKTAESRDSLVVANLALKQQPWVAISCKAPPNPLDKMATREHEDEMIRVKECLQGQHGFESQEECQWALNPPTNVEGFVSGKIWAIARVGDTSDVRQVEKQRLDSLNLDEARSKYSEIAGFRAANELKNAHEHHNRGLGVTKAQYIQATMDYMENAGIFVIRYDKWFDTAANVLQDDGSRIVSRLKQTCTTTGAARKWVTTVTDVMILNYAVGLDVARDGTQCNTQGVWPCKLPIDSLPLQILAMSPDLMEDLRKQPRRCFP